jgi:glycosyltransferase 2 family protein
MVAGALRSVNGFHGATGRNSLDMRPIAEHNALRTLRQFHQGRRVKKSFWLGLLKYALGFVLLAYVVYSNWDRPPGAGLKTALANPVQWLPFLAAATLLGSAALLTFYRWWILVRALGMEFSIGSAMRLGLVGFYFNTILPGGVGGDIVKAVGIAREQTRRALAVSTVLFDRAVGLWALVWLVALSGAACRLLAASDDNLLTTNAGVATIVRTCWLITIGSVAAWWALGLMSERRSHRLAARLATVPKAGRFLSECWRATWLYRKHPWVVIVTLAMSIGVHVLNVLAYYFAARVFLPPSQAENLPRLAGNFLVVPVGMAVQAFFPTPGGVGGSEYGFGKLYGLLGKPEALGVLASLSQRVLQWILGLIGYLVYLRMKPPAPTAVETQPAEVGTT